MISSYNNQKHKQQQQKIGKLDFIRIKKFCASKLSRKWRQPTELDKIFASHVTYKRHIRMINKRQQLKDKYN